MRNKSFTSASRGSSSLHPAIAAIGRLGIPALGVGFALWGAAVLTGLAATGHPAANSTSTISASAGGFAVPAPSTATLPTEVHASAKSGRAVAAPSGKSGRLAAASLETTGAGQTVQPAISEKKRGWAAIFAGERDASFASDPARVARFARVASHNPLTKAKLASLFGVDEPVMARREQTVGDPAPSTERFGIASAETPSDDLVLAYADPSPAGPSGALAALSAVSPQDEGALSAEDEANDADGTALFPDYEDTPEETPLPLIRPRFERAEKPTKAVEEDTPRQAEKPKREKLMQLAYAKPNNPADDNSGGGIGNSLKNLFNRPKVGNGVAVYDISAAKVYMPDGSVLEAHSGIGEMADNPKYVHVKMKGPTPPHTYNLKMREKRFHGVEAIRMLPVDGRNKHGRDGFLTHSYLLRGGRAESHGCVAFKDYGKFLNAFKQGKIRQLVVVPGGGRSIARNVQKGRDA